MDQTSLDKKSPKKPSGKFGKKYDGPPRPLTANGFHDAAVRYLERYSSTVENLRRVLYRRIKRWEMRAKQPAPPEAIAWADAAVDTCVRAGFVNDDNFVEQKIMSLRRAGRSARYIQQSLVQKGASPRLVSALLHASDDGHDDAELNAALRMAKRKRMTDDDRNLARLMRAGFSLNIARAALRAVQSESAN